MGLLAVILAVAAWAAPQQDAAQKHLERAIELFNVHDDSGETLKEAQAEFERALRLNPRLAAAVAYLGFIAAEEQHPADAEAAYRKALEMDRRCAEARVGLARLHAQNSRVGEALGELRQAVADNPRHRLALWDLGLYLVQEHWNPTPEKRREAIRCFRMLVELDRNNRDAHHQLAQAHEQFGEWANAERHYREVLRIGQTDDDLDVWVYTVHANVAEMLEKQGKLREAIRSYEALIASQGAGEEEIERTRARIEALRKRLSASR